MLHGHYLLLQHSQNLFILNFGSLSCFITYLSELQSWLTNIDINPRVRWRLTWLSIRIFTLMFTFVLHVISNFTVDTKSWLVVKRTQWTHMYWVTMPLMNLRKKSLLHTMTHARNLPPRVPLIHICHDLWVTRLYHKTKPCITAEYILYFIWYLVSLQVGHISP